MVLLRAECIPGVGIGLAREEIWQLHDVLKNYKED